MRPPLAVGSRHLCEHGAQRQGGHRQGFSDKPMWDILDIQDGDIHGEGLQNRTESQVGKDQMGGESEKGERGERTDGSEMEGEEQNEKRRQGKMANKQNKNRSEVKMAFDMHIRQRLVHGLIVEAGRSCHEYGSRVRTCFSDQCRKLSGP